VVILFFEGSIRLDRERTEAARNRPAQAVPEIKGEVLRASAWSPRTSPSAIARSSGSTRIASTCRDGRSARAGRLYRQEIGMFMLNLLILVIFGFLLLFYRIGVYGNVRHVTLLASLIAVLFAAAAAAVGGPALRRRSWCRSRSRRSSSPRSGTAAWR
jgi:hypothetical protein